MAAEAHPSVQLGVKVRLAFERQEPGAVRRPFPALRVEGERAPSMGDEERATRDENGTEIFRIDRFRFLYYEPFFNMKNCQFQSVSQPFSTIFCTL
jgi:hypothetical protein